MKYDLRISVKDYRHGKSLKIQLAQLNSVKFFDRQDRPIMRLAV
jgi:hypothetical protein